MKPKRKKNIDTSTANLSPDDKRTFSKIKKLIVSRDKDKIDMAVELTISLNNCNIYNSLLKGCKLLQVSEEYSFYDEFWDGNDTQSKLVTNKLFTGKSGPAQPFLNYALMCIIANVPDHDDIEIDKSIQIKNITELNLTSLALSGQKKHMAYVNDWREISKDLQPRYINNFIFLKKLRFRDSTPIIQMNSVTELICNDAVGSLKWMSGFTNLEKLTINAWTRHDPLELDSFKYLINLRELKFNISEGAFDQNAALMTRLVLSLLKEQDFFLKDCRKLKKLSLDGVNTTYNIHQSLLKALPYLKNLEELEICGILKDIDLKAIAKCKKLKSLTLGLSTEFIDLSDLNSCINLSDLYLFGGTFDFNAQIESINGIKPMKKLKELSMNSVTIREVNQNLISQMPSNGETTLDNILLPEHDKKKTYTPATARKLKSEDKKTFTKIKSFLQARDFDKIDKGIELLRSINIVEFYEVLLANCKIIFAVDMDKKTIDFSDYDYLLLKNSFFKGSAPAQPYLNYALYLLIYYCPDEAEIDDSLRKKNINRLYSKTFFKIGTLNMNLGMYINHIKGGKHYRLPLIENFTSLNEFEIDFQDFDLVYSKPEDVLKNSSVEKIIISGYRSGASLMWLKNFPQLKSLFINDEFSSHSQTFTEIKDLNVLKSLTNLEELEMGVHANIKDVGFLKNCVKLKQLNLRISNSSVTNFSSLKNLTDLEDLVLALPSGAPSYDLVSELFKILKNCNSLKTIIFVEPEKLGKTDLSHTNVKCDINLRIASINGLTKSDKLKKIVFGMRKFVPKWHSNKWGFFEDAFVDKENLLSLKLLK